MYCVPATNSSSFCSSQLSSRVPTLKAQSNLGSEITRVGILILATPCYNGYKNCWSDAPMQQEGWVRPLPTYIMGAVHHEMGIRSSQLIVSRCTDSV